MKKQQSAREQFESIYRQAVSQKGDQIEESLESKEVWAEQAASAPELGGFSMAAAMPPSPDKRTKTRQTGVRSMQDDMGLKTSEELQQEKDIIKVRETGFFIWKTVIVPPNAYVVHTRRGRQEPVTLGLGTSFKYNSYTDSYLIVPAAMQTIGIVANCITQEKQGINVLAYVQWLISDFSTAYKKLDFSDTRNPVAIVNAQLREQAEAAIKDKIATMSIEEVLTDKAPIIEELTSRMKKVAEGRGAEGQEGLGLKIVTVQIKEALVSSQSLWTNLQAPFRNDKEREARLSNLVLEEEVHKQEISNRLNRETRETTTNTDIQKLKSEKETEGYQIEIQESSRRQEMKNTDEKHQLEMTEELTLLKRESERKLQMDAAEAQKIEKLAELQRQQVLDEAQLAYTQIHLKQESQKKEAESELEQLVQELKQRLVQMRREAELALLEKETVAQVAREEKVNRAKNQQHEIEILHLEKEQMVMNQTSEGNLKERLIRQLPILAEHMPDIDELKTIQISGNGDSPDPMTGFLTRLLAVADTLGLKLGETSSPEM